MDKLAVITIAAGELYKTIANITHPRIKAYADKCGAEFVVWDSVEGHLTAGHKKLEMGGLFKNFDRVLYVDTDILIREDAPNLFEMVHPKQFGAFNEGKFVDRRGAKKMFNEELPEWWNDPTYYNTGVMIFSHEHVRVFDPCFHEVDNFYEQTLINQRLFQLKIPMFNLSHKFNRLLMFDKLSGQSRLDSYFLHYAGQFGSKNENVIRRTLEVLVSDDQEWKDGIQEYYPRKIHVEVGGGLGDVVCAEPVIRHIAQKFYSRDEMVVHTHWPEVFAHLNGPNLRVLKQGEGVKDLGFYEMNLMPKPDNLVNNFVAHALCHPTDYASLMAFKGQLSVEDKRIKLYGGRQFLETFLKTVLIHPGKGWPGKTYPVEFWQGIIDGLIAMGLDVAVIGKRTDGPDSGYVNVNAENCRDLRDQLSLKDLFAVVKSAPILISNDSSPIHIAGAFDNYIGLVTTLKPAHSILPFRHGSQNYKTKVFGTCFPMNFDPAQLNEVRFDQVTAEDIAPHLPNPNEIFTWVKSIAPHAKEAPII